MKISHASIKALKPCDIRYENFKKHYPEFDSDLKEFLYLEEISYSDKVWVFTRLATKEQNIKWAIMCVESVIDLFETKYPTDLRPRAALEAFEAYIINPTKENKRAATAAYAAAAYTAAYVSGAAAYAAYAAVYAADAAAYAAAAGTTDAYYNTAAEKQQEQLNLMFMVEAIK